MLSMTRLYQLTALAGVAFHAEYEESRWHWGGQLATGPLFYGSKFSDGFNEDKAWPILGRPALLRLGVGATRYGALFGRVCTAPEVPRPFATPSFRAPTA